MDIIIAMGHFCDTHGPSVILCTHVIDVIPEHSNLLNNTVCSACESVDLDTVYSCEDDKKVYVTSRVSLNPSLVPLLKDAVLRSLSVEIVLQDGKTSGTMYFGDNNRGHIIAHVFSIKDSFARGFRRRYCIIVLGKNQVSLLSHYGFIDKTLRKISDELQQKAEKMNLTERSSTTHVEKILRSLPQLVGERNIFAQLHMWFVFLLRAEIFQIMPHTIPSCPVNCSMIEKLRNTKAEMSADVFDTISYCILTGIRVEEKNVDIVKYFQQLLPKGFILPASSGTVCVVSKIRDKWDVSFKGTLPSILPTMQISIKEALEDKNIGNAALEYHIMSFIMHWFSIACVLSWTQNSYENLVKTLEVRKCDMPLLTYWIPQSKRCVELSKTDYFSNNLIVK